MQEMPIFKNSKQLLNPEQNPQISNLYMFEYLKRRKSNQIFIWTWHPSMQQRHRFIREHEHLSEQHLLELPPEQLIIWSINTNYKRSQIVSYLMLFSMQLSVR
jgi:hypothetical protein